MSIAFRSIVKLQLQPTPPGCQDGRKAADTKFLESRHDPEVKKWMKWADKELAVLLFPNLTRNFQESYQVCPRASLP